MSVTRLSRVLTNLITARSLIAFGVGASIYFITCINNN